MAQRVAPSLFDDDYTSQPVFDDERGQYLILDMGWHGDQYLHATPIHISLIDDKVWVRYGDTEEGLAADFRLSLPTTSFRIFMDEINNWYKPDASVESQFRKSWDSITEIYDGSPMRTFLGDSLANRMIQLVKTMSQEG